MHRLCCRCCTREVCWLQQPRSESPSVEKLHQPHVLRLVTQSGWRKRQAVSEAKTKTCETAAKRTIIPDCVRLSCLCLLFLVARPAWRLRPILHPVELWIALTWTQVFSLWCSHATAYFTGVCIKSINKTMKNALKCIWQTTSHATKYYTKIKKYPWYMQTVHTFHWKKYLDLLSAPREAVAARAGVW